MAEDRKSGAPEAKGPKKKRASRKKKTAAPEPKPEEAPASGSPAADGNEGKLTFDPSIVTEIAIREAQQIEGIVQLTGSFMDDWVLRRGKGVHVEEEGGEAYSLDLKISVEYGVDCVKLAKQVRDKISKAVKKMTGRDTHTIDVHVTGISHKDERAAEPHDEAPVEEGTGIDF